jgi:hypothetical protein
MGEIFFDEIIIAFLPARSLPPAFARDGPFVELLIAQLLSPSKASNKKALPILQYGCAGQGREG